jgi:hypothetical protein
MGVYTHIGLHDQTSAIESLPAPPELSATPRPAANGNGAAQVGGSTQKAASAVAEIGQLEAVWGALPDDIKSGILALASGAVVPQQGCGSAT